MTWTRFMDMHSGGSQKLEWSIVLIEQPQAEAKVVFYKRFGRNPDRVTCTCCGADYSIDSEPTLARATAYDRNCRCLATPRDPATGLFKQPEDPAFGEHYYLEDGEEPPPGFEVDARWSSSGKYQTVEQYLALPHVKAIRASEITPEETRGEVPSEGYVWAGSDE